MFQGIFVPFKKFICTFNVLTKSATMRRRPSEAIVLFQLTGSKHCKAVGEVWPETRCRDYRSQSDSYRASRQKSMTTWQRSEIRVSILLGIGVIARFYLSCCLLADRIGLWSAECGQVNLHQHVFAAQSPCAKTFKSTVGSGDSALGISPILQLRQWFPTFFDAFLPLLILELFIPPLSNVHSSPVRIHRQVQLEQRSLWTTITWLIKVGTKTICC